MIPLKDNLSCKIFPIATIVLIALNCVAFLIELTVPKGQIDLFFNQWASVPSNISDAFASGHPLPIALALLTVLTAMFLHGGWMHIIGNMVFFQAFGRAVESRLGSWKFAIFYIIGGFAAWGLDFLTRPYSDIPSLGASGAIAAVLGAYLVFYPKAQMKTLFLAGVVPILAVIPAWSLLIAWFAMQVIPGVGGLTNPLAAAAGVAYWAHIGGFLFGVIIAGIWALVKPVGEVCYTQLSCKCDCKNGEHHCCKKGDHKVQVVKFWQPSAIKKLF